MMTVLIKDSKGNVVIEKEIDREEVLLRVSHREDERLEGQKEYTLEQIFGSYH